MTSLLHESGSRANAWRVKGAVCAHSGPVPPLGASLSPLEDHQPPRTGPALCPDASDDAFAPPHSYRRVCALLYNPQEGWRDSLPRLSPINLMPHAS